MYFKGGLCISWSVMANYRFKLKIGYFVGSPLTHEFLVLLQISPPTKPVKSDAKADGQTTFYWSLFEVWLEIDQVLLAFFADSKPVILA